MPENETPTTATPAAEQAPQPATQAAPAPDPDKKPEGFDQRSGLPASQRTPEDWRYAYATTQKTVDKLHASNTETRRALAQTQEELRAARETLSALAKQNLGPEQAAALEERQRVAAERSAARAAAETLEQSVQTTITLVDRVMASAGLSDEDRQAVYAAAKNTSNIHEWATTVHALASERIEKAITGRISKAEGELRGKALAEAKAEAEAVSAKAAKELGIDKVDTSTGAAAPTKKSVAEMSDAEFAVFSEQKRQEREQRRLQKMGIVR